jgi:hypothetical protein
MKQCYDSEMLLHLNKLLKKVFISGRKPFVLFSKKSGKNGYLNRSKNEPLTVMLWPIK